MIIYNDIGSKTLQTEWLQRLDELRDFKRHTGHCSVPMKFPDNPGLARWVHTQRMRRRNGKMSAGRARQLEKLGFVFEGRSQWEQVPCALCLAPCALFSTPPPSRVVLLSRPRLPPSSCLPLGSRPSRPEWSRRTPCAIKWMVR